MRLLADLFSHGLRVRRQDDFVNTAVESLSETSNSKAFFATFK